MTGIVNYGAGNVTSVARAVKKLGQRAFLSADPEELRKADRLIFPGVGEASSAMRNLRQSGLDEFLKESHGDGTPIFGICLGSQIILDRSEEGNADCLGLIAGTVRHLDRSEGVKIPHMGFNSVTFQEESPLFRGIPQNSDFYFVHSYYTEPADPKAVLGICDYEGRFPCVLRSGNLFAAQFHPEKSGEPGLRMIENFLTMEL